MDEKVSALDPFYQHTLFKEWCAQKAQALALAFSVSTAAALLQLLAENNQPPQVESGALQLMTMHKAKGLEWTHVILPFLHRPLNPAPPRYPAVDLQHPDRLTWKHSTSYVSWVERQNTQRLLYVALTRAKNHLVLVDDSVFYPQSAGSLADILAVTSGGAAQGLFHSLPLADSLPLSQETSFTHTVASSQAPSLPAAVPAISPSQLSAPQKTFTGDRPDTGMGYGEVWHTLWHQCLQESPADLTQALRTRAASAPFSARLQKELESLFQTDFYQQLKQALGSLRSEVPFWVRLNDTIMEGRVDLIVSTPERFLIIDWKTDNLPPAKLKEVYGQQLQAYRHAFQKLTDLPVEVMLYSTPHATPVVL